MFWGWFSFDNGGFRRGGGCIFLPILFICGSFTLFGNLNGRWLWFLAVVALLWFAFTVMRNGGNQWVSEKPKRNFTDEKPKRDSEYMMGDDGEIIEVVDSREESEGDYRNV